MKNFNYQKVDELKYLNNKPFSHIVLDQCWKESFLEKIESCDSNRICDNFGGQYVANYPYKVSIAVDTLKDLKLVQKLLKKDKFFKRYSKFSKKII